MTNINLSALNDFLDTFKKNKAEAEAKIAQIDEEYRRLAEEKKKELNETVARCQKEIDFWENSVISRYSNKEFSEPTVSAVVDEPVFEAPEVTAEVKQEEDVVVDTLAEAEEPEEDFELPQVEDGTTVEPSVVVDEINIPEEMEAAKEAEVVEDVVEEVAEVPADTTDDEWASALDDWQIPNN